MEYLGNGSSSGATGTFIGNYPEFQNLKKGRVTLTPPTGKHDERLHYPVWTSDLTSEYIRDRQVELAKKMSVPKVTRTEANDPVGNAVLQASNRIVTTYLRNLTYNRMSIDKTAAKAITKARQDAAREYAEKLPVRMAEFPKTTGMFPLVYKTKTARLIQVTVSGNGQYTGSFGRKMKTSRDVGYYAGFGPVADVEYPVLADRDKWLHTMNYAANMATGDNIRSFLNLLRLGVTVGQYAVIGKPDPVSKTVQVMVTGKSLPNHLLVPGDPDTVAWKWWFKTAITRFYLNASFDALRDSQITDAEALKRLVDNYHNVRKTIADYLVKGVSEFTYDGYRYICTFGKDTANWFLKELAFWEKMLYEANRRVAARYIQASGQPARTMTPTSYSVSVVPTVAKTGAAGASVAASSPTFVMETPLAPELNPFAWWDPSINKYVDQAVNVTNIDKPVQTWEPTMPIMYRPEDLTAAGEYMDSRTFRVVGPQAPDIEPPKKEGSILPFIILGVAGAIVAARQ